MKAMIRETKREREQERQRALRTRDKQRQRQSERVEAYKERPRNTTRGGDRNRCIER